MSRKTKKETGVNAKIQAALAGLDAVRVENPADPGTPDINFKLGWIETKLIKRWPKKKLSPVRVRHYTPQQRAWHVRRHKVGGFILVVIEVEGYVFVYDGLTAAQHLGFMNRAEMESKSRLCMDTWNAKWFRDFVMEYARDLYLRDDQQ